jgi:hypothetical protein
MEIYLEFFVKFLGKAGVPVARKMVHIAKKTQETKGRNPGPREYGSWTIQTYQGRWIDPGSTNPRSNGYKHAAHHKIIQAHGNKASGSSTWRTMDPTMEIEKWNEPN